MNAHSFFRAPVVLLGVCAVMLFCSEGAAWAQADPAPSKARQLWYEQPAQQWVEALPVGNGRLGAMVFGRTGRERIQLNEETMWAGHPEERHRAGAPAAIDSARRLLFDGQYVRAEKLVGERVLAEALHRSYQTLGELYLTFDDTTRAVTGYRRSLSLDSALAQVRYRRGGTTITQEVLATHPDDVIAVRLTSSQPGGLSLDVALARPADATVEIAGSRRLRMYGRVTQGGNHPGVRYDAQLALRQEGGHITPTDTSLHVQDADAVTILVAAATDYRDEDPRAQVECTLEAVESTSYAALRRAHIADYRRYFDRVALSLGGRAALARRPTDERLERVEDGKQDRGLMALYFQYGRYLLISSSRPGTMPANLQGLWNRHIAAPWNSDYHVNINIQMIYWPAEVTGLPELHHPFFDLVDSLRVRGRETARAMYGADGFVTHHTTDAWWFTTPIGEPVWGMWVMGGAWATRHLYEHYRFTQDRTFLAERAYPAMKEAAQFMLDWLVEHPESGRLVSGPSTSPENTFLTPEGEEAHLTMGPAMDQQIIWDLFTNVLDAADVLNRETAFVDRVRTARERLAAPVAIGPDGRIMEWPEPFEEAEPGHRHVSHLYALHPGRQIAPHETPEWAAAARKTLDYRLAHGGGHTGWSRAWLINFWARLHEAGKAHANMRRLLQQSTLPNLFDTHPPFQLDGNMGGTAGVAEMLVQSHTGEIQLLPALPEAWSNGSVRGLRARGGFVVDLQWNAGALTQATLHATTSEKCRVRTDAPVVVQAADGGAVESKRPAPGVLTFGVEKGQSYVLTPR